VSHCVSNHKSKIVIPNIRIGVGVQDLRKNFFDVANGNMNYEVV
jgi:hypothetical protein